MNNEEMKVEYEKCLLESWQKVPIDCKFDEYLIYTPTPAWEEFKNNLIKYYDL